MRLEPLQRIWKVEIDMSSSRRSLIKAAVLAPVTIAPAWRVARAQAAQFESLFSLGSGALADLASKVLPELAQDIRQAALESVAKQIHVDGASVNNDALLPLLHADDLAHARTVCVHGMVLSQTQVGILALLDRANLELT